VLLLLLLFNSEPGSAVTGSSFGSPRPCVPKQKPPHDLSVCINETAYCMIMFKPLATVIKYTLFFVIISVKAALKAT